MGSRAKLIAGGVVTYVSAVFCTYTYLKVRPPAPSDSGEGGGCGGCHCATPFSVRSATKYDEIAQFYDQKIDSDELVMGVKLLRWHLASKAKGRVLEVASGTGRNLGYYKFGGPGERGVSELVLTDKSEEMVKTARDKIKKMGIKKNVQIDVGDGSDLSRFTDDSFDTVVDTFGLCSFDNPVKVLLEMQRVCKKDGGKILLIEHGRSNYWEWLDKVLDDGKDKHVEKWGCEWNRDIDRLVKDSGLVVESRTKWHFGTTTFISGRPEKRSLKGYRV